MCACSWRGEGTSVHSHNCNLGDTSAKDKQIKATLGHFIKTCQPSCGRKQTGSQLSNRSETCRLLGTETTQLMNILLIKEKEYQGFIYIGVCFGVLSSFTFGPAAALFLLVLLSLWGRIKWKSETKDMQWKNMRILLEECWSYSNWFECEPSKGQCWWGSRNIEFGELELELKHCGTFQIPDQWALWLPTMPPAVQQKKNPFHLPKTFFPSRFQSWHC